jgi:ACS family D-galactonate transporter-like MFS transporter
MSSTDTNAEHRTGARWFPILALVFVATLINYLSRAVFGLAKPMFMGELHIDQAMGGVLSSAFAITYAAAQIPVGALLDKLGTRLTYFLSLITWSCFTLAQGFASSAGMLFGNQIGNGLCESPCFPANSRVLAHWFPQKERARANSIYAVGQTIGTGFLVVPLLWMANNYGWRSLFLMTGAVGILWGFVWYAFYREPQESPFANKAERDYIVAGGGLTNVARVQMRLKYILQLLSFRQVLCASIAQFCGNTVLVFFLFDFANYLKNERHMNFLNQPIVVALPYIGAALGGLVGAFVADSFLKNGASINFARKLPVVAGLLLASCIALVDLVPDGQNTLVIFIMCVAFFGQGATNLGWTVISDLAPKQLIGVTGGVFNMITNLTGIFTPLIIGWVAQETGSFTLPLVYVGALPLLGVFLYVVVMGDVKRLEITE